MILISFYSIIVILSFFIFSLFDFIIFHSDFNLKKVIKHPFYLFYCWLYDTLTNNFWTLILMSILWPITLIIMIIVYAEYIFKLKGIRKMYQKAKSKIMLD